MIADSPTTDAIALWGPLAHLVGDWEGAGGLDCSFNHARGAVIGTPYHEKVSMKPFGPVGNGRQSLYGLDYKTAMWREGEDAPFHTELGYWLYDAASHEILRAFVVPRGLSVLAGGTAAPDATTFTMTAKVGDPTYGIGENRYLSAHASSVSYDVTVTVGDDGTWSYEETTTLRMSVLSELLPHTDRNTLRRV